MPHVAHYLGLLHKAQVDLAIAFREVADGHVQEVDVFHLGTNLARECDAHAEQLKPFVDRYGEDAPDEPDRLHSEIFQGTRSKHARIIDPHIYGPRKIEGATV